MCLPQIEQLPFRAAQIIMDIRFETIEILAYNSKRDAKLLFADNVLVLILTCLDDEPQEGEKISGKWFVEVGFGPCDPGRVSLIFDDLDQVSRWASERITLIER